MQDASVSYGRSPNPTQYGGYSYAGEHRSAGRQQAARLATVLGWFSIGLGLAELLAPQAVAKASGVRQHGLLRALGGRELASGIGILSGKQRPAWLWSRVAGDLMDLAVLALAARSPGAQRQRIAVAAAAVAGVALADTLASARHTTGLENAAGTVRFSKTIVVNRPPDDCYRFWRDLQSFPRFMQHLELVQAMDEQRSHWKARGPAGTSVEWDAQITQDVPGRMLAWRTLEGSDIEHSGAVHFERAAGGRGTLVSVEMQYRPPAGKAGVMVAKLFGEEPELQISGDLRRFKQLIETGEIPTTVGQPSGQRSAIGRLLRKGEPG